MVPDQRKIVVTVERIERWLDMVAELMDQAGDGAKRYLPIWRALERERDKLEDEQRILREARLRVSNGRTGNPKGLT